MHTHAEKARILKMQRESPDAYRAWLTAQTAKEQARMEGAAPSRHALLRASEANPPRVQRMFRSLAEIEANPDRDRTPPDPYRAADANPLATAISATLDPRYNPHGQPPDGYLIALAARRLAKEDQK